MLSKRKRPGSSSTSRIRPRGASLSCLNTRLWICTIFAFPDRALDARDRIELLLCLFERLREPLVLLERGLKAPRGLVVLPRSRRVDFRSQAFGLAVENQALLHFFQVDRDEHPFLRQQRRPGGEQGAQPSLRLGGVAARMTGRRDRERELQAVRRRRRLGCG